MKGLPNSRSEDTLLMSASQRVHSLGHQRSRSSVLTASVSATTSPLLSVRSSIHGASNQPVGSAISVSGMSTGSGVSGGNITATSESQHSLSSEDSAVVNIGSVGNRNPAEDEDDESGAGSVIVPIPSSGILQSQNLLGTHGDPKNVLGTNWISWISTIWDPGPHMNFELGKVVYAAYKTGLASGSSLKVHVPQTSAREVVYLVVKQLNLAAVRKGKGGPVYPDDRLENFCLLPFAVNGVFVMISSPYNYKTPAGRVG
ncbi:hypothetical protein FOCC_FOCC011520 [Frankliniella occidentalis]|nr:hypothetical protein FOCC_FOCC011520 [Frankliniella occidentalis]